MLKDFFFKTFNYKVNPTFKWVDFVSPSTLHLAPFIKVILEPVRDLEEINRIQLGLHEALVNAVRHGNESDPSKLLRVRTILTPNWFVLQIQDEGSGMPFSSRSFALPDQLDAENGRGLFLMHQCFDDIRWSPRGNRLQLAYRR